MYDVTPLHALRAVGFLPVLFLCYCSGLIPDLLSFPTRRSSDLGVVKERLPTGGGVFGAGCAETHCCTTGGGVAGAVRVEDRKSTRLNSSHRCISYAVFCLKKKKIG